MRAHMTSGSIKKNRIHHQAALVSVSLPHPRESQLCGYCLLCLTTAMSTPQSSRASKTDKEMGAKETKEGMEKQEGGSATTASHRNDVAVATTAITTRRGSSNNSGTLPGKMK